ncbi:MAG: hypothetical protein ABSB35_29005 [Bryobacteraceae bacterium]|jgi:hypothetical protein
MATATVLALLIEERAKLDRAIEALGGSGVKRRGRPPKNPYDDPTMPDWVKPKSELGKFRRKRTAAQRKKQALAMKAYWAKRKKAEA